ncbi:hypothetical protein BD779DRAFT_1677214 [Infundibulicybe gibba]|nr:hypothetical protein BD779DRAFT_1677214 [Infundibulicybe gibba]
MELVVVDGWYGRGHIGGLYPAPPLSPLSRSTLTTATPPASPTTSSTPCASGTLPCPLLHGILRLDFQETRFVLHLAHLTPAKVDVRREHDVLLQRDREAAPPPPTGVIARNNPPATCG